MAMSLGARLRRVEAKVPHVEAEADNPGWRYLRGEGPLPEGQEHLRVARRVRDRWRGTLRPGEWIDGMAAWEKERTEQIIRQFRGYGLPPEC